MPTAPVLGDPSFAHGTDLDLLTPRGTMHSEDRESNNHSGSRYPSDHYPHAQVVGGLTGNG